MKLMAVFFATLALSSQVFATTLEYKGVGSVKDKNGNSVCRLSVHRDKFGKIFGMTLKGYADQGYGVRWTERKVKNLKISSQFITAKDRYRDSDPSIHQMNSYDFKLNIENTIPTSYKLKWSSALYFMPLFPPERSSLTLECKNLKFVGETANPETEEVDLGPRIPVGSANDML